MIILAIMGGAVIIFTCFGESGNGTNLVEVNPATGLQMTSYGVDLQGNPPGIDLD